MPKPNRRTILDETDAKAATNEGVVRWVLLISVTLTVIAFAIIVITGALSQDPVESQQNVERRVQEQRELAEDRAPSQNSSIDGIVVDNPDAGAPPTTADQ